MDRKELTDLSGEKFSEISFITQEVMGKVAQETKGDAADTLYAALMCSLGALSPTAFLLADKSKTNGATLGPLEGAQFVTRDTILLAGLIAAYMQTPVMNNNEGNVKIEFGPGVVGKALQDWEKLTGKSPDDVFPPSLVSAARAASLVSNDDPWNKFMKNRTSVPASGSKH